MTRVLLGLVAALIVALVIELLLLQNAQRRLDVARAEIIGLTEWARVQTLEMVAARSAAALDMELQQGVGADAPLSDYALRGAGRVWGGQSAR